MMAESWYENLPQDFFMSQDDKVYAKAFSKIRDGLAEGLDFDAACTGIEVDDEELRKLIIDDMLKVLIAEEHFTKNMPLEELAKKLKVSQERLDSARSSMLSEVEDTIISASQEKHGPSTE